ncbi:uncharacterized protein MELLADRAFT_62899 [Melampsora larici-populina 98AG31]|uniref:DUF676 domain-containing protein n=1 Tax=Melampsora larici-populina (strain 98AG31 / pathotype 3-4-7) TaxID=747676 RepID=F4RKP0_MELLP|nr:uncharacterized protein MELLADRAFT_62899 [Melampsora larici-populina 98AG31]EGG07125.1 hypothetical protein MELLADRAFT_62899 [Melampsora larici-populina 98AG31]
MNTLPSIKLEKGFKSVLILSNKLSYELTHIYPLITNIISPMPLVNSKAESKEFRSPNYLQGLLNGVPYYDPCGSPDGPIPSSKPNDAPFSQGENSYQRAIHCPLGIQNLTTDLPKAGFDICWINLPFHGLGDMQLSGEFVAYAVNHLANLSVTAKINIVTYSQGGSNAQWAITFWPSIRTRIINLITISAPHKGTFLTDLFCKPLKLMGGCLPSVLQMSQRSNYMSAVYKRSIEDGEPEALVPTTSIYTFYDELVLPQVSNPNGVSYLSGASNIAIQEVCGQTHIINHFGIISDMATYGLVYDALIHGRPTSLETFDHCIHIILLKESTVMDINLPNEPLLMPYHYRVL